MVQDYGYLNNQTIKNNYSLPLISNLIDNLIIATDSEKDHNELVEEILKRIEKNYLYVKLEKYQQRVKKVGFLEVVLEPDGIKIEK